MNRREQVLADLLIREITKLPKILDESGHTCVRLDSVMELWAAFKADVQEVIPYETNS